MYVYSLGCEKKLNINSYNCLIIMWFWLFFKEKDLGVGESGYGWMICLGWIFGGGLGGGLGIVIGWWMCEVVILLFLVIREMLFFFFEDLFFVLFFWKKGEGKIY